MGAFQFGYGMRGVSFPVEHNLSSRGGVGCKWVNLVDWSMSFVDRNDSQWREFKEELGEATKGLQEDQLFQSRILVKSLKMILRNEMKEWEKVYLYRQIESKKISVVKRLVQSRSGLTQKTSKKAVGKKRLTRRG
jgi:hypothetical protein